MLKIIPTWVLKNLKDQLRTLEDDATVLRDNNDFLRSEVTRLKTLAEKRGAHRDYLRAQLNGEWHRCVVCKGHMPPETTQRCGMDATIIQPNLAAHLRMVQRERDAALTDLRKARDELVAIKKVVCK